MGEHEFEYGQLCIVDPDRAYSPLGDVTDVECTDENIDISVPVASLTDLEASFTTVAKVTKDIILAMTGMYQAVIECCPDKRVAHLALYAKKARTRKKNCNRAFRILEEIG